MVFAGLIKAIGSLLSSIFNYLRDRKLIEAGRNEVILEAQDEIEKKRAIAADAVANVDRLPVSEDSANRANKRKRNPVQ